LAPVAGLVVPTEVRRKDDLVAFLSSKLPALLPRFVKKLTPDELLECEILAAAGGFMPKWELITRLKIENRKKREQEPTHRDTEKKRKKYSYDDEEEYDDDDDDYNFGYHRPTVLDLFVFHRHLESVHREAESGTYLIMPKEARDQCFSYVQKSILDSRLSPLVSGVSEVDELFFESPELFDLVGSLLERISENGPKPTPKENLLPKSVMLPIFEQHVAKTAFYKTNDDAQLFGWNDLNETLMAFLYSSKLVKTGGKGFLEVNPIRAQEVMSSGRKGFAEQFLKWWASRKDNQTTIIKSRIYQFEGKPKGLRSDEVRTREILMNVLTRSNELEPGRVYSRMGLIDRCRLSGGMRLFDDPYGNAWSPNGVVEDLFSEFLSMMILFPLCFLGVLEISKDSRLVRLGKWVAASSSALNRGAIPSGAVTVTPNFEIIVQPEARTLGFQLREFCEKIDSPGPALLFRITKKKLLEALRKGDYNAEKIISIFGEVCKLPDNVSHELRSWGERYGEVEVKTMEVIRCRDEATAETLLNDREARKYILGRIGETTLELRQGNKTKILSRCDQIGLFARG
ncbi:MAG: helicase-associated domain-containing protein, partial [Nitrososphaerales archaeon]